MCVCGGGGGGGGRGGYYGSVNHSSTCVCVEGEGGRTTLARVCVWEGRRGTNHSSTCDLHCTV